MTWRGHTWEFAVGALSWFVAIGALAFVAAYLAAETIKSGRNGRRR